MIISVCWKNLLKFYTANQSSICATSCQSNFVSSVILWFWRDFRVYQIWTAKNLNQFILNHSSGFFAYFECWCVFQTQLEENFFHNLPASHKRTVDFVADRVASNHIKKFRGSTLRDLMEEGRMFVMDMMKQGTAGIHIDIKSKVCQLVICHYLELPLSGSTPFCSTQIHCPQPEIRHRG